MAKDSKPTKSTQLTRVVTGLRAQRASMALSQTPNPDAAIRPKKSLIRYPNSTSALRQHVDEARKTDKTVVATIRLRPRSIEAPALVERTDEPVTRAAKALRKPAATATTLSRPARAHAQPPNEPTAIRTVLALGDVVRHARRRQGLSQADLASAAGTGRRFISDLEAGKPTLEFERLLKVCHALGIALLASEPER